MIEGLVAARFDAVIEVQLRGPSGALATISAVVDTGYDGYPVISFKLVHVLELPSRGTETAVLADGTVAHFQRFEVTAIWNGREIKIDAEGTQGDSLIGMRLLAGCRLMIDVIPGGRVMVTPLP